MKRDGFAASQPVLMRAFIALIGDEKECFGFSAINRQNHKIHVVQTPDRADFIAGCARRSMPMGASQLDADHSQYRFAHRSAACL